MIPWASRAGGAPRARRTKGPRRRRKAAEHHESIAEILMHHVVDQATDLHLFGLNVARAKHLLWFAIAAAVLVVVRLAIRKLQGPRCRAGSVPRGDLVVYVRDRSRRRTSPRRPKYCAPPELLLLHPSCRLLGLTPFSSTARQPQRDLGLASCPPAMQWVRDSKYASCTTSQNMIPPDLPCGCSRS